MFEILITNKDDSFTVIRTSQPVVFTNNCLGYKPDNQRQTVYLQRQIDGGKDLYMLTDDIPVGIVSVSDNMIENLYVLPERWHCGYGSHLLAFAIGKCDANPVLTVLNNNTAIEMYRKFGFKETGKTIPLNPELWEIEMILER